MKTKVKIYKETNYKGHVIYIGEDEIGQKKVFVDIKNEQKSDTYVLDGVILVEDSPNKLTDEDFDYASVEDAKRIIRGENPKYVPLYIIDFPLIGKRYYNRFK